MAFVLESRFFVEEEDGSSETRFQPEIQEDKFCATMPAVRGTFDNDNDTFIFQCYIDYFNKLPLSLLL